MNPHRKLLLHSGICWQQNRDGHTKAACGVQDHASVQSHPNVMGMAENVFFWEHNHPEGGSNDESKSKFNTEEADMAIHLVRHLLLQVAFY
jgi:hypothetical protein